jgi:hypothetical protein
MTDHPRPWTHNHDDGWVYDANGVRFLHAKMNKAVAEFSNLMRDRMSYGDEQGKTGWDKDDCPCAHRMHHRIIRDDAESMVDLANLAMMRHRQLTGANHDTE